MANNSSLVPTTAQISDAQLTVVRIFTISTSILGTTGNFLTIFAILKGRLYQNPSFIFILNLSVCNFIHCFVFHPLLAAQAFSGIWANNATLCIAYSYALFSNMGTELWGYACITLNRYFCVVHHHIYGRIYGNARYNAIQVIFSWLFYPVLLLFPLTGAWSNFEYAPQKLVCHPFTERNCSGFCLFVYVIALGSTIPVIIFCYASIIHKYTRSQRKVGLSRDRSMHMSMSTELSCTSKVKRDSDKQKTLSELKMAFTILGVIVVFSSCRLPFMIMYLYDPTMVKLRPIVHTTLIYVGSNSNWVNPIVYAFTNVQIHNSLRKHLFSWNKTLVIQKTPVQNTQVQQSVAISSQSRL